MINMTLTNSLDVTVVVCTHNRAESLRQALASLYHLETQEKFSYEVLVIDNASGDATPAVIADAAREASCPLRGIFEPRKGIVAARNRGVEEARGEWLAFFDDDQLADPRWLAELLSIAQKVNAKSVGGGVHLKLPTGCQRNLRPLVRTLLGEANWSEAPVPYKRASGPGCGNWMIHRSLFERVGRFEAALEGRNEDSDLYRRICLAGETSWFVPAAIIHHVITPDRLEEAYLLRLARIVGDFIAHRENSLDGRLRFAALRLLKSLRSWCLYRPSRAVAQLLGDKEKDLELLCLLAAHEAYLERGRQLLHAPSSPAAIKSTPAVQAPSHTPHQTAI